MTKLVLSIIIIFISDIDDLKYPTKLNIPQLITPPLSISVIPPIS
ncbi:hypothetical protein YPPY34_0075 [Yersinia pestis PY-34]|nr:hypothetical protein YPPY01_0033 [Yersinia pestis PY-01]EIQ95945.1 hypothetical protein YPPY02_0048 [Yersinia pestis PY-02]EIR10278.1 hypothetical protein YPPY05_0032 [Yersinia pestis PY-05]EIR40718.1 hypothetical protein YPPY11_0077 [Yersinia pestis PY-11]EIR83664.1 hypothetical protein YPPY34_0075 [Yersinia pestis PY-34]EIS24193.1 hypothetical protein YPPY52_0048 [Yersinia pestis PY-52]EIS49539.1 hypothetical protein YPPY60_0031 [Yersinia pestis PY-60]EIS62880.1 hypothetical protein YPP